MTRPRPLTAQDYTTVRYLYSQGIGIAQVCVQADLPKSQVVRILSELDIPRDGTYTRNNVAAIQENNRLRRARLAGMALVKAEDVLDKMNAPTEVFSFGGKDNEFNSTILDEPPASALRDLSTVFRTLSDQSLKLDTYDRAATDGAPTVDEWLSAMTGTSAERDVEDPDGEVEE